MATLRLHVQSSGVMAEAMDDNKMFKQLQTIENASCRGLNRSIEGLVEQSRHSIDEQEGGHDKVEAMCAAAREPAAPEPKELFVSGLPPEPEHRDHKSQSPAAMRKGDSSPGPGARNAHAPHPQHAHAVRRRLVNHRKNEHAKEDLLMADKVEDERAVEAAHHLHAMLDENELVVLKTVPDPVLFTAHRIVRAVSTQGRHRGWKAPAPIVSRIFQELSNGLLAYNHALKLKEIPMPFAYVQFNALLLLVFNLLAPIAIACFTETLTLTCILTLACSGGFTAMWLVANELEDPFGIDDNDLPMLEFHEGFCQQLRSLLVMVLADDFGIHDDDAAVPLSDLAPKDCPKKPFGGSSGAGISLGAAAATVAAVSNSTMTGQNARGLQPLEA